MKISRVVTGGFAMVAAAALLMGCTTKVITSGGTVPLNTVTAAGAGKTVAAPDMAEMYFGVSVRADDAATALSQASANAEKIASAVKGAGVSAQDIQTVNVSVYPLQTSLGGNITITGYQASVQVRAKIRDIKTVGTVITAANKAGANEIGGPSFTLADDSNVRNEALTLAIADARKRADAMAKAVGKSLGETISVSESGVSVPIYTKSASADLAGATVPIEPGQLNVTASVTVVFELK
ncbi:MAG: SIMPL domain-containing protein [Coriobacteriia bacterium]|nr:SIMPL domain-containing protein [Coriobacteriia bacterium]